MTYDSKLFKFSFSSPSLPVLSLSARAGCRLAVYARLGTDWAAGKEEGVPRSREGGGMTPPVTAEGASR